MPIITSKLIVGRRLGLDHEYAILRECMIWRGHHLQDQQRTLTVLMNMQVGLQAAATEARQIASDAHSAHQGLRQAGRAGAEEAERAAESLDETANGAGAVAKNMGATVQCRV